MNLNEQKARRDPTVACISIWSAGLGVNSNIVTSFLNGWLGPNLFRTIGQNNADKVRGCIKLLSKDC
jgi:hypothetical protein